MKFLIYNLIICIVGFSFHAKSACLIHTMKELNDGTQIGKSFPVYIQNTKQCCVQGYNEVGNLCGNSQVLKFTRTCTNESGLIFAPTSQATCSSQPIAEIPKAELRKIIAKPTKEKCSTLFSSIIDEEVIQLFKNSVKVKNPDDCKKLAVSKAKVMCISQRVGRSITAKSSFSGNTFTYSIPCSERKVAQRAN